MSVPGTERRAASPHDFGRKWGTTDMDGLATGGNPDADDPSRTSANPSRAAIGSWSSPTGINPASQFALPAPPLD
jgi:hypothetical protein